MEPRDDPTRAIVRLRALARLLDAAIAIPGTRIRVGIDPILGLLPGLGDAAGFLLSFSILVGAYRLGAPRDLLARMAKNVAIETIAGTVPILGDIFDVGWKANLRNVKLLEDHFTARKPAERAAPAAGFRRMMPLLGAALLGAALTAGTIATVLALL